MRFSVAFRVIWVYLLMSVITLGLAGILTNRAIKEYVINSTRNSLIYDAKEVIGKFKSYSELYHVAHVKAPVVSKLTVAAQSVNREYIVVDPSGQILWSTFSNGDFSLLAKIKGMLSRALNGYMVSGIYPATNPVYEYVAIPFTYATNMPIPYLGNGTPKFIPVPSDVTTKMNTKVVVLFAKLSDLQRITMQIWLAVAQGLLVASIISTVTGVIIARRMMTPVRLIRSAIERVRKRDFSVVPEFGGSDEWGDFVRSFAEMVGSLRAFDEGQKRFLQNASHELKTPLMAIRGYAEGLRDGVFDEHEAHRALDIIAQESVRLKKLVDDLIYLSKLETLDEVYNFLYFDMALAIYKTIERIHPLAKERGIRILPDIPDEPVLALVDRDKIVQALLNLASNAIRHSKRQIYIRLVDKEFVTLIVEDDGDGFQDNDVERVFERFFHGSKGETGLGLTIAKAIVEKHRGQIFAENAEGGGARFTIQLPH